MLKLVDLISLAGVTLAQAKIHLATGKNPTPLEAYFAGEFKVWQERQNNRNFECEHIVSLIFLGGVQWLFAGVWKVKGVKRGNWKPTECYLYDTQEVDGLDHLTGRAIVLLEGRPRNSYLKDAKFFNRLYVQSLRSEKMTMGDFPGYNSALLSFRNLNTVLREKNPSWKSALSNVSGVYLITDTSDGRKYIGSAYGGEGIWHRWGNYARTGHGGNKELKSLLKEKGSEHSRNFEFFLLEVCDLGSSEEYVISRENHWKSVLHTREFGLNKN